LTDHKFIEGEVANDQDFGLGEAIDQLVKPRLGCKKLVAEESIHDRVKI
jgi:hypothetical protein